MPDKDDDRLRGYIVIALTASTGKKYEELSNDPIWRLLCWNLQPSLRAGEREELREVDGCEL